MFESAHRGALVRRPLTQKCVLGWIAAGFTRGAWAAALASDNRAVVRADERAAFVAFT